MENKFDLKIFKNNIDIIFKKIDDIITEINNLNWDIEMKSRKDWPMLEDVRDYRLNSLKFQLNSLETNIAFAIDHLNLTYLIQRFEKELNDKKKSKLIELDGFIDFWYSPKFISLKNFVNALLCASEVKSNSEDFLLLERLLRGTPKLIFDENLNPKNENEIQKEVYKHLIHIFPDTLREFSIPKVVKSYKPDFGIKSLKCAIEYKFIDSEKEARKFCGEIFEDVHAYQGYEDWKIFYAVIYMTDAFFTQDQIEHEFKICGIPENWKPIVVYGKGERKKKTTK